VVVLLAAGGTAIYLFVRSVGAPGQALEDWFAAAKRGDAAGVVELTCAEFAGDVDLEDLEDDLTADQWDTLEVDVTGVTVTDGAAAVVEFTLNYVEDGRVGSEDLRVSPGPGGVPGASAVRAYLPLTAAPGPGATRVIPTLRP
jgi:hypothetical protein